MRLIISLSRVRKKDWNDFQMRALTATLNLTTEEKLVVQGNFESALIKLLYAFVWQEWAIGENPIIYDPAINEQGADLIPVINAFANSLNTFPIYDQDVQVSH